MKGERSMWLWEIIVEAWPFSTGNREEDQKACGPRSVPCHVRCNDIKKALSYADVISQALKRNPRVWEAPVMSVRRLSSSEECEVVNRGG